jgi:predicted glycosyltransferase
MATGEEMRIWYDACTGKHIRYGAAIAKRLRRCSHEVIFTTREHPDTVALAKTLGEDPVVIGRYDPTSLFSRLEESARRMLGFSDLFRDNVPDLAISHQSVELCRVAFGLNIPIILTADTPHATAVNKLTIPLSNTLIISEAIPKGFFKQFGAQKIIQFKGVDEVAWAGDSKLLKDLEFEKPLIVVRQMETKAAYALGKGDITVRLAHKLTSLGNVLFLPRYDRIDVEGLTLARKLLDSASLVAHADLVVSVGGTISREAALQGVPSIAVSEFGHIPVNEYLSKKGFPLFIVNSSKVLTYAKKYLGKRFDVKRELAKLENPIDIIETLVNEKSLF